MFNLKSILVASLSAFSAFSILGGALGVSAENAFFKGDQDDCFLTLRGKASTGYALPSSAELNSRKNCSEIATQATFPLNKLVRKVIGGKIFFLSQGDKSPNFCLIGNDWFKVKPGETDCSLFGKKLHSFW